MRFDRPAPLFFTAGAFAQAKVHRMGSGWVLGDAGFQSIPESAIEPEYTSPEG